MLADSLPLLTAALVPAHSLVVGHLLWIYMDPGTMMPVASGIAAVVGVLLMFWHRILRGVRKALGLSKKPPAEPEESGSYASSAEQDGGVREP